MDRRTFLRAGAAITLPSLTNLGSAGEPAFTLDFAPHFGMFKHSAPGGLLDELRFAHDQ